MVTISTIIPAYNAAKFVREAVDSALAQSGVENEVIVVDDGSTDETPEILRSYGDAIRVLRQNNGGHVNARNNGTNLAQGEWLAFLDADDVWKADKLAKQLALAVSDIGMVYTDRENFGDVGRVNQTASAACSLYEGDLFEPLLSGNFVTVASVIMRKDWFERLGGFNEQLLVCEDWDMWLRFAAEGGHARVVREPLTRYRWHSSSMTNNQTRMCEGRLKVVERALTTPRGAKVSRSIASQARANAWKCSAWYAMPWNRMVAARWYCQSLRYWPWDAAVYKQLIKCCLALA